MLSLASISLQSSLSPVWLSIAASLVARLTRTQNDSQLSDEDLAKVGRPIEAALTAVLQALSDLSCGLVFVCVRCRTALTLAVSAMDENPDLVQAFLSFCNSVGRPTLPPSQTVLISLSQIVRNFPRVLAALPNHLDAIFSFAERGLGMQENFSLRANIDLLVHYKIGRAHV